MTEIAICSRHFLRRRARARAAYLNGALSAEESATYNYRVRRYEGPMFRWAVTKRRRL